MPQRIHSAAAPQADQQIRTVLAGNLTPRPRPAWRILMDIEKRCNVKAGRPSRFDVAPMVSGRHHAWVTDYQRPLGR